jgi:hypothetical protein
MSFFPVKYFLQKFFPAAWFSGEDDIVGPRFANMAATMVGSGSMAGTLSADVSTAHPPVINVIRTGVTLPRPERRKVFADTASTMTSGGTMTSSLQANGALHCTMSGKGTMTARPIIDITRLLKQRRAEEEAVMALLLAVG